MEPMTFSDCWPLILRGLGATMLITILSLPLGTWLGGLVYAMSQSRKRWLKTVAQYYRIIVRGTPMLVLLLFIFYVILSKGNGMLAAVLAFSINFSNFAVAIIQSSIDAVGREQIEAGRALGLSKIQNLRYVVIPQALRYAMPAYKYQAVGLLKSTSIVGYVAIQDITQATEVIRHGTGQSLIPLLIVTILYFILAWLLVKLLDKTLQIAIERRKV